MPLVIAGGPSVNDYPRDELIELCKISYVIAVNNACFHFPCDVVVILDPLIQYPKLLDHVKNLGKPIICRRWSGQNKLGLDLIELPNAICEKYPFSGMAAAKLSDALSEKSGGRHSYVLGIDASNGNFNGYTPESVNMRYDNIPLDMYEKMGLKNTINLSMRSNVPYWPKQSKLPHPRKLIVNLPWRIHATAWIRAKADEVL